MASFNKSLRIVLAMTVSLGLLAVTQVAICGSMPLEVAGIS